MKTHSEKCIEYKKKHDKKTIELIQFMQTHIVELLEPFNLENFGLEYEYAKCNCQNR